MKFRTHFAVVIVLFFIVFLASEVLLLLNGKMVGAIVLFFFLPLFLYRVRKIRKAVRERELTIKNLKEENASMQKDFHQRNGYLKMKN